MVAAYSKAQLGKDPKGLKVAIIHEDGPYGIDVAKGTAEGAAEAGFQVVVNEGYSASAPDLSSLVTKLKRGQPEVIFHTGYNPDITLFLRQARELGLKFSTLIGHGGRLWGLPEAQGDCRQRRQLFLQRRPDLNLADQPQVAQARIAADHQGGRRRVCEGKARYGHEIGTCRHGRIQHLRVLTDILPRAIKKYGGATSDDLRQAALDTDLPDGSTMLGFGIKFEPPGAAMAGQNERAYPVVVQYIDDQSYVVWPKAQQQREPMLKLPPVPRRCSG